MNNKKYIAFVAASALLMPIVVPTHGHAVGFSDTVGNSHEKAIQTLVEMGVIQGYSDGTFRPNQTLTRSDIVKMMGKWLVTHGFQVPSDYKTNLRFTDLTSSSNDELLQYAALLKDLGIFTGTFDGELNAQDNISRENMAIILVRAYDAIHNADFKTYVREQTFEKM